MTQTPPANTIDITQLSEYGEALRKYRLDKGEADRNGDELGALRAESEFQRTQNDLMQRQYSAMQHRASLETARAKAAADFPKVKPELYAHIDNPDEVLARAQQIAEAIDEAAGPGGGQSWGGAPTGGAPQPPSEPQEVGPRSPEPEQFAEIQRLAPEVYAKGRRAAAENARLRQLAAAPILNRIIDNASQSVKMNLETGEPL